MWSLLFFWTVTSCENLRWPRLGVVARFYGAWSETNYQGVYNTFQDITTANAVFEAETAGRFEGVEAITEYLILSMYQITGYVQVSNPQLLLPPEYVDDTYTLYERKDFTFVDQQTGRNETFTIDTITRFQFGSCASADEMKLQEIYLRSANDDTTFQQAFFETRLAPARLCQQVQSSCQDYPQFTSLDNCLRYYLSLPDFQCQQYSYEGQSKACKWLHLPMAIQNPSQHCDHVGATSQNYCNLRADCQNIDLHHTTP